MREKSETHYPVPRRIEVSQAKEITENRWGFYKSPHEYPRVGNPDPRVLVWTLIKPHNRYQWDNRPQSPDGGSRSRGDVDALTQSCQ